MMIGKRCLGLKKCRPRVNKLATKTFKPLFNEMPAVKINNKIVCLFDNFLFPFSCFPAIYKVSKSMKSDKIKWSGATLAIRIWAKE